MWVHGPTMHSERPAYVCIPYTRGSLIFHSSLLPDREGKGRRWGGDHSLECRGILPRKRELIIWILLSMCSDGRNIILSKTTSR